MSKYSFSSSRNKTRFSNPRNNRRPQRAAGKGVYIDPAKFINEALESGPTHYEPQNKFSDFDINPIIKDNLAAIGYDNPTAIQDKAIPLALEGKNVIGLANTGTGKTAAFGVPMLHKLSSDRRSRAIVMAPTRELAQQIEAEFRKIAKKTGIHGAVLIGGSSMSAQLRDLRTNPSVVIGTPGRIKDHIEQGSLKLDNFNIVVLDEVDRMLDMGFINDIRTILGRTAQQKQSLYFSATLDASVRRLIDSFSPDCIQITVPSNVSSENINQDVVRYQSSTDKLEKLHTALIDEKVEKAIVFDETKRNVERLGKELAARGFSVDSIHGGKTQGQRQRALRNFKENKVNILVATNVAARGIDVSDITHVINYSVPQTYDDYIHRIGRAGRAGRTGHALTFVTG